MKSTVVRAMGFAVLFAGAVMGGSLVGLAQQNATPPDILSALLIEVRGLRAAMEQAAFAGPSVQILLGRVQLQEQRITNQVRRLDAVRASLVPAQQNLEPMEREAKEFEESLRRSQGRYNSMEEMLKEKKAEVTRPACGGSAADGRGAAPRTGCRDRAGAVDRIESTAG